MWREDYSRERIALTFNPLTGRFEVPSPIFMRSAEWIPDITAVFADQIQARRGYLGRLKADQKHTVDDELERQVEEAIQQLAHLLDYAFQVVQIKEEVERETVADIFVRINSEGVSLSAADFILTWLSVFWEPGRGELERWARNSRFSPAVVTERLEEPTTWTPQNPFMTFDPGQILRVSVAVGLRRARLADAYNFLRGRDPRSREIDPDMRAAALAELKAGQVHAVRPVHWDEFLKVLERAGFRTREMITSEEHDPLLVRAVDHRPGRLRRAGRRATEGDGPLVLPVADYRALHEQPRDPDAGGPQPPRRGDDGRHELHRSAHEPDRRGGAGRLVAGDADRPAAHLLGERPRVRRLRRRAQHPRRRRPTHHLEGQGLADAAADRQGDREAPPVPARLPGERARAARQPEDQPGRQLRALVEWSDNITISNQPPSEYWPREVAAKAIDEPRRRSQEQWHSLPQDWTELDYDRFLADRRRLMANVIHEGFKRLTDPNYVPDLATPELMVAAPVELPTFEQLVASGLLPAGTLLTPIDTDRPTIAEVTEDGYIQVGEHLCETVDRAAKEDDADVDSGWDYWQARLDGDDEPATLADLRERAVATAFDDVGEVL